MISEPEHPADTFLRGIGVGEAMFAGDLAATLTALKATHELLGYDLEELRGRPDSEDVRADIALLTSHADGLAAEIRECEASLESAAPDSGE